VRGRSGSQVQPVIGPLSPLFGFQHTRVDQDLEVVGHGGLAEADRLGQSATRSAAGSAAHSRASWRRRPRYPFLAMIRIVVAIPFKEREGGELGIP
jgi:hypothetical protein